MHAGVKKSESGVVCCVTALGRCDVLSLIVKSRLRLVEEGELVTHAARLVTHAADHSEKSRVAGSDAGKLWQRCLGECRPGRS